LTYETFGRLVILKIFDYESKKCLKTLFELTKTLLVSQKLFSSKINLKPVADIVFDLRNEFYANRMKLGDFGEKIFFCVEILNQKVSRNDFNKKNILCFGFKTPNLKLREISNENGSFFPF
jgi:hypothetical protein